MSPERTGPDVPEPLTSHAYQITVDDGSDSFFALGIEGQAETEWLVSDTVCALENMR